MSDRAAICSSQSGFQRQRYKIESFRCFWLLTTIISGQWLYIVNIPGIDDYQQGVVVEECLWVCFYDLYVETFGSLSKMLSSGTFSFLWVLKITQPFIITNITKHRYLYTLYLVLFCWFLAFCYCFLGLKGAPGTATQAKPQNASQSSSKSGYLHYIQTATTCSLTCFGFQ